MSRDHQLSGIRPPPPNYKNAGQYPRTPKVHRKCFTPLAEIQELHLQDDASKQEAVLDQDFYNAHVYQTFPVENVFVYKPTHYYSNVAESLRKFEFIYSRKVESGKPLVVLHATPETLASSSSHMGVKTYAQLEVIAPEQHQQNRKLDDRGGVMCGVGGVNSADVMSDRLGKGGGVNSTDTMSTGRLNHCSGEMVQSNGKAVLLPINGVVTPDRMLVESILSDVNTDAFTGMNGSLDDLPPPPSELYTFSETDDNEAQIECDVETIHQALAHEHTTEHAANGTLEPVNALDPENGLQCDARDGESVESTPLLQALNAQSTSPKRHSSIDLTDSHTKRRIDCEHEYADSGYSDCNRLEFKEHNTDHNTDHVTENVIYSEPEYSSSDMSVKCVATDSPKFAIDKCQRTLKRTANNGVNHTVYELSPSDSFYSSADNLRANGKKTASMTSSDGICRIARSSSSLADGPKTRPALNRETSVSFKKPLVVGPMGSVVDMQQPDAEVDTDDGDPLVSPYTHNSVSSIPSHIILENTRTYYRRKAADRGTLYCACGGITVVATIVFLLIYFS